MSTQNAREALFHEIRTGVEYVMVRYGGIGAGGDYALDTNVWRAANLPALLDAVMTFLRAGLNPYLERQAIADGVTSARQVLAQEFDQIAQWVIDDAASEDEAIVDYAAGVAKRLRDLAAEHRTKASEVIGA